jgi:hypothetical protein
MSYYSPARSRPLTLVRSQLNPSLFAAASASLFAPPPSAFTRRPPSHRRRHTAALAPPPLAPAPSLPHCIAVRRYAPPSAGCTQPRRSHRPHTLCTATVCRPRARAVTSSSTPAQTLNPAPPRHSLITIPPPLLLRASRAPHCVACGPYIALASPRHRLVPPAQNRHRTAFCCLSRWVMTRERVRR